MSIQELEIENPRVAGRLPASRTLTSVAARRLRLSGNWVLTVQSDEDTPIISSGKQKKGRIRRGDSAVELGPGVPAIGSSLRCPAPCVAARGARPATDFTRVVDNLTRICFLSATSKDEAHLMRYIW